MSLGSWETALQLSSYGRCCWTMLGDSAGAIEGVYGVHEEYQWYNVVDPLCLSTALSAGIQYQSLIIVGQFVHYCCSGLLLIIIIVGCIGFYLFFLVLDLSCDC